MSRFYNDYDGNDLLFMEDYLEHYGRKGQKPGQHLPDVLARLMAIGHRPRRSRAQKQAVKRRRKAAKVKAKQKAATAKKRTESLEKARQTRAQKLAKQKEYDKIVDYGSAEDIYKVANYLSPAQRQRSLDRLRYRSSIEDYMKSESEARRAKVDNINKWINTGATTLKNSTDLISAGRSFMRTISPPEEKKKLDNDNVDDLLSTMNDVSSFLSDLTSDDQKKK